jgi:hypothetical protein
LKKTTVVLLLLLIAVMWLTTFTRAQEFTAPTATTIASTYDVETGGLLERYRSILALSARERSSFFRTSSASEKSTAARIHLALQLVRRHNLSQQQMKILLDAISLSSLEFFAAADGTPAEKTKANEALRSLARRAHGILPLNETAELFVNIGGDTAEDEILRKYTDISALPLTQRKAAFRNASSKDKSDLWKTHLALFLVKRPDLDDWQRETVLAAMKLATPGWFEVKFGDPTWKAKVDLLGDLQARILATFSIEDGAKIFATLGDPTESAKRTPGGPRPIWIARIDYKRSINSRAFNQWAGSQFAEQDLELEGRACQCSTESNWCGFSGQCKVGDCSRKESGCGTLWSYPCDGASCQ